MPTGRAVQGRTWERVGAAGHGGAVSMGGDIARMSNGTPAMSQLPDFAAPANQMNTSSG